MPLAFRPDFGPEWGVLTEFRLNEVVDERWEGLDEAFQGGTGNEWGGGLKISGSMGSPGQKGEIMEGLK